LTESPSVFLPFGTNLGTTNSPVGSGPHLAIPIAVWGRQVWQSFDGPGCVHKPQMRIGVHCQSNIAMAKKLL
jgi:hypothetical protein